MSVLGYVFIAFMFALMIAMVRELRLTLKEFRVLHEGMREMHKTCCSCMCDQKKKEEKEIPIARTHSPKKLTRQ